MNSRGAPERIGRGHSCDQGLQLGADGRAAPGGPAGACGPVLAEAATLPTQDGVRGDDDQRLLPASPQPGQRDQKSRSPRRNLGRATVLLYTASCWRRARFSRASWRGPPQRNGQRRSRWSVLIMEGIVSGFLRVRAEMATACPPDGVLAKHRVARSFPVEGREVPAIPALSASGVTTGS